MFSIKAKHVIFGIVFIISLAVNIKATPEADRGKVVGNIRLKLTEYYETLCPDARTFFTQVFKPNYEVFIDYVEFTLVPYGFAKKTSEGQFTCQHGPDECLGNMYQACALKLPRYEEEQLKYCTCVMTTDGVDAYTSCGQYITNFAEIDACAKGEDGKKYLAEFGDLTGKVQPPLTSTPSMNIEGKVLTEEEKSLMSQDIVSFMCSKLPTVTTVKPEICNKKPSPPSPQPTPSPPCPPGSPPPEAGRGKVVGNVRLKITEYYETLCSGSRQFFSQSFKPNYKEFIDYIEFTLVPYGFTKKTSDGQFTCQHGPDECLGNIYQACALKLSRYEEEQFKYCTCVMTTDGVDAYTSCGQYITNFAEIDTCAKGEDGKKYLAEFGDLTEKAQPPLTSIPSMYIEGKVLTEEEKSLMSQDIVSFMCSKLPTVKPEVCNKKPSPPSPQPTPSPPSPPGSPPPLGRGKVVGNTRLKVTEYYETLCTGARQFFNQIFKPNYKEFIDYIEFTLVPYGFAKKTSDGQFTCQHGPDECLGNMYQACALKLSRYEEEQFKYCTCVMTTDGVESYTSCGQYITNFAEIDTCAKGEDGKKYLAEFGDLTEKAQPPLASTPSMYIEGNVLTDEEKSLMWQDFVSFMCGKLPSVKPEICDKKRPSPPPSPSPGNPPECHSGSPSSECPPPSPTNGPTTSCSPTPTSPSPNCSPGPSSPSPFSPPRNCPPSPISPPPVLPPNSSPPPLSPSPVSPPSCSPSPASPPVCSPPPISPSPSSPPSCSPSPSPSPSSPVSPSPTSPPSSSPSS